MRGATTRSNRLDELLAALQSGVCDEATARRLYQLGPHAVTLALLSAARRIAELQTQTRDSVSPSTPSGMTPVYAKPNADAGQTASGRRRKKPGARDGHTGHRRPTPTRIDERQQHRLKVCPGCGGPLQRCQRDMHAAKGSRPLDIVYERKLVDPEQLPDAVQTWECFGRSVLHDDPIRHLIRTVAQPLILVKPKVLDVFRENKVRHVHFEPVRIIDD